MLDRTRRTVTDKHVIVALLANHKLKHARKGHKKGKKGVKLGRGIKSTTCCPADRPPHAPTHPPRGHALTRPFFGRDAFVAWLVAKPLHRPSRAPGGPELEVLGNDESWQPRL